MITFDGKKLGAEAASRREAERRRLAKVAVRLLKLVAETDGECLRKGYV